MLSNEVVHPSVTGDSTSVKPLIIDTDVVSIKIDCVSAQRTSRKRQRQLEEEEEDVDVNDVCTQAMNTMLPTPPITPTSESSLMLDRNSDGGDRKRRRIKVRIEKDKDRDGEVDGASRIILRIPPRLGESPYGAGAIARPVSSLASLDVYPVMAMAMEMEMEMEQGRSSDTTVDMKCTTAPPTSEIEQHREPVEPCASTIPPHVSKLRAIAAVTATMNPMMPSIPIGKNPPSECDNKDAASKKKVSKKRGLVTPPPTPLTPADGRNKHYLPYRRPRSRPVQRSS